MQVSIFSFAMAVIWSSVIVLIQYFFLKKRYFVKVFGTASILLLCVFSVMRVLIPVELPFTKVVVNRPLWNKLYDYLCLERVTVMGGTFQRVDFLIGIWLTGAVILSALFTLRYMRAVSGIRKAATRYEGEIERVLERVIRTIGKPVRVQVFYFPSIGVPVGLGVFKKTILLPNQKYSEDELFCILLHEITHFANRDILLKILLQLFSCIFWWNPLIYLLRKDLAQVLEIKCDLAVVANMDKAEKISYLSTIVQVVKQQRNYEMPHGLEMVSVVGGNSEENIVERFKIVSEERSGRRRSGMKILWYVGFFGIVLASYSFIIQAEYDPPKEEIVTDENAFEITVENTFIVKQSDGKYLQVCDNGFEQLIPKKVAEEMVSDGFKLKGGE